MGQLTRQRPYHYRSRSQQPVLATPITLLTDEKPKMDEFMALLAGVSKQVDDRIRLHTNGRRVAVHPHRRRQSTKKRAPSMVDFVRAETQKASTSSAVVTTRSNKQNQIAKQIYSVVRRQEHEVTKVTGARQHILATMPPPGLSCDTSQADSRLLEKKGVRAPILGMRRANNRGAYTKSAEPGPPIFKPPVTRELPSRIPPAPLDNQWLSENMQDSEMQDADSSYDLSLDIDGHVLEATLSQFD